MTSRRIAVVLALLLAALLTIARGAQDWPALSILRLPDNDDMMRLAEVRDWLGGQRFHDLLQHRLGPPGGASMHWSRIADLGPAALLALLTPLLGERAATLTMLFAYQAILLAVYLLLAARNARLLIGERAMPYAVVLAALAFPTITLFVPGRIDHHALQIVLTMVTLGSVLAVPSFRQGALGGIAAALSLAVGLEVAPELIVAIGVMGLLWLSRGRGENARLGGFALGLGVVTLLLLAVARPEVWPEQWCDGFTPASSRATLALAAALGALALVGRRLLSWRARIVAGIAIGGIAITYVAFRSTVCFAGPYGALDPYLQHAWMGNVAEARGLFYHPEELSWIGFGGLSFASLVAVAPLLRRPVDRQRWWPMALFLALNVVALVLQVRVTYILAGIATLPFAALLARADRPEHLWRRLSLWVAGSGVMWGGLGSLAEAAIAPPAKVVYDLAGKSCSDGARLLDLAREPRGVVMVPLDTAAYVIGMTPHRSVAAPYHRNNSGNMAMYRFFLSPPAASQQIARRWQVDYVVTCATSLDQAEVANERPRSLIEALQAGNRRSGSAASSAIARG